MDIQEQRLQCLKMAMELGEKSEDVISAANNLMTFVTTGATPAGASAGAEASPAPAETLEPQVEAILGTVETVETVVSVADPIAACGTALEMPDSGDLAQAAPPAGEVSAADAGASSETEAQPSAEFPAAEAAAATNGESESTATTEDASETAAVETVAAAAETAVAEVAPAAPNAEPVEEGAAVLAAPADAD